MPPVVIRAEGLSKQYRIGARQEGASRYRTLREAIQDAASWPLRYFASRGSTIEANTIWALKDVSFEVQQGRAIGIIGRNGAGKSTLLKILSRITEPTSGRVAIRGRVASLLEVGTGFHPELTGRENIMLNAAILGMSRREVSAKFDEIVGFAEVDQFIDTPVKRYSSGMRMRLAFAVAAHLEPDILVIDEVLAVGDAAFQKKCLGKMESVATLGRTVLFVSHSMPAVRHLCSEAILLRQGRLVARGSVDHVISEYLSDIATTEEVRFAPEPGKPAYITRMGILDAAGRRATRIVHSEPFSTEVEYVVVEPISADGLAWMLASVDGVEVTGSLDQDWLGTTRQTQLPGRYVARVTFPGGILNAGMYHYRVALASRTHITDYKYGNYFEILDDTDYGAVNSGGHRNGVILQRLRWETERIPEAPPVERAVDMSQRHG